MDITEVRIKLISDAEDRLRAFCSITFDNCFVVRDIKIIEGTHGPFVAMPSRKLAAHCPKCRCKNHLRANFCNQCGLRVKDISPIPSQGGRVKLYADIAHPVNSTCREMIQQRVLQEFTAEMERAQQPGYIPRYDDDSFEDWDFRDSETHVDSQQTGPPPPHAPRGPYSRMEDPPEENGGKQPDV